jgi:hypothetical protein
MGRSVLVQDATTIVGNVQGEAKLGAPREALLYVGDCDHVLVSVCVAEVDFPEGALHPRVVILTAATLDGPWIEVGSTSNTAGETALFLSRDPEEPDPTKRLRGYLTWQLAEPEEDTLSGDYEITFRITAVLS